MDKNHSLTRIHLSRQALLQVVQNLGEGDLTDPKVEGVWTIKDLLGHLTAWELACCEPVERFQISGAFQCEVIPDHDAWNAVQAALRQAAAPAAVIAEMQAVRQRLVAAASQCTQDQWAQILHLPWGEEATLSAMLNGLAWHEEEHLKSILAWRSP